MRHSVHSYNLSSLITENIGRSQPVVAEAHQERYNAACVTELMATHIPTEADKAYLSDLISKLQHTDSIREATGLQQDILTELKIMEQSLFLMREEHFEIINPNSSRVYGILSADSTTVDRDHYIKTLVQYFDTLYQLTALKKESDNPILSSFPVPRVPHHSTGVYGDLDALNRLRNGDVAKLPALTYNQGETQFG